MTDADPLFMNTAGGDFRIPYNSPLRDLYIESGGTCAIRQDVTGVARDTKCDASAFEYIPAAPVISSATATPSPVAPGATVALAASATDANPGETAGLTYSWNIPGVGTFTGTNPSFTAPQPAATTTYTATLTVTDITGTTTTTTIPFILKVPVSVDPLVVSFMTFTAPDGVVFKCLKGDYGPPAPTVAGVGPTLTAIRARKPVRVTVTSNETGSVIGKLTASWTARTLTGRLITRRITWTPLTRPTTPGVPVVASFPISLTQRNQLLATGRVGAIKWVGFGIVKDTAGNARGYLRPLAPTAATKLSVVPPRLNCNASVPDTAPPSVAIPTGQKMTAKTQVLNVSVNEGAKVSVRVVSRVSVPVDGVRKTITFNIASGSATTVRGAALAVPLRWNMTGWQAYKAALAKPGALKAGSRAYVVATDTSLNTRKTNQAVTVL